MSDALKDQVGGEHYKNMPIQPIEYCHRNGLGVCESFVVKYVSRYKTKNGLQDLQKAKHMIELLIDMTYPSPCSTEDIHIPATVDKPWFHPNSVIPKEVQEAALNAPKTPFVSTRSANTTLKPIPPIVYKD